MLRGHVLPASPANCGGLDEHGAKNCFSCEMMRCANQAGRVALGFELIEPLGSAQGTVISTPRAGLSAGSRCRGSRRRPNCTICGVRDVGEPDFHFGASQTDGSNRDADRTDPSSDDVVEASADFRRLAVGSRHSLRAGRSSIWRGICRHRRQRSAVPGYRKVKVRRASDHLRLGPRRRSAASPIWPRFWMRSDLSRRWRPKVRDRRAIGWRQSRDGISRDRGAFHLAESAYRIGYRPLRALSRQPIKALGSNGFLSKQTAPAAAAFASSPGSARAVIMMTGTLESRAESSRLRSNPLMPGM